MATSIKPTTSAPRAGWVRAGSLCLLAGALTACGGGSSDPVASATAPSATAASAGTAVKSVEKNDPLAFSENQATVQIAETKCRKHTYVRHGESSIRKSSRESLRKDRCRERGSDDGPEVEKVG